VKDDTRNDAAEHGHYAARGPWWSKKAGNYAKKLHKKLDSPGVVPYHTSLDSGARRLGTAGTTEGPARQLWPATLASPLPRGVCSWCGVIIVYFSDGMPIFFCVCGENQAYGLWKGDKFTRPLRGFNFFAVACCTILSYPSLHYDSFLIAFGTECAPWWLYSPCY